MKALNFQFSSFMFITTIQSCFWVKPYFVGMSSSNPDRQRISNKIVSSWFSSKNPAFIQSFMNLSFITSPCSSSQKILNRLSIVYLSRLNWFLNLLIRISLFDPIVSSLINPLSMKALRNYVKDIVSSCHKTCWLNFWGLAFSLRIEFHRTNSSLSRTTIPSF